MSETKHTPGPWSIDPRASMRVTSANDRGIAACGGHTSTLSDTTEENQANTQLIAAAPELLDALKDCLLWLNGERTSCKAETLTDLCQTSVRAIAKAKGELK